VKTTPDPTVTAVICAYTEQRWDQMVSAVESARTQSRPPLEVIVSIDHNPALFERASTRWKAAADADVPVTVVINRFDGRLGSARTTAAQLASGDVLAFLDDDAEARPDWLEHLIEPYAAADVVAVGGAPVPRWETGCPRWFPPELFWVFGCAYLGLPTVRAPLRHLIGANMSVRRTALERVGGFHSDNHDDMDMCHRVAAAYPESRILFEPSAVVDHWVGRERATWSYFWRRCFFVNRGKVEAFRSMGAAGNWEAEIDFVLTRLPASVRRAGRDLMAGDPWGVVRAVVLMIGTGLAGAGSVSGQLDSARARWTRRGRRER
jgi:cellulose synthase/poly-beta-1,6-N-acetylglucosamine synthase-like glycosyltransferase